MAKKQLQADKTLLEYFSDNDQKSIAAWSRMTSQQKDFIRENLFQVLGPGKFQILDYSIGLTGGKPIGIASVASRLHVPVRNILNVRMEIIELCAAHPLFGFIGSIYYGLNEYALKQRTNNILSLALA